MSWGCAGVDFTEWLDSPIDNTRSRPKINATLDGNKCCDVAWCCLNNATTQQNVMKAIGGPIKY